MSSLDNTRSVGFSAIITNLIDGGTYTKWVVNTVILSLIYYSCVIMGQLVQIRHKHKPVCTYIMLRGSSSYYKLGELHE